MVVDAPQLDIKRARDRRRAGIRGPSERQGREMASAWVGDIESPVGQAKPLDHLPERDGEGLTSAHEDESHQGGEASCQHRRKPLTLEDWRGLGSVQGNGMSWRSKRTVESVCMKP